MLLDADRRSIAGVQSGRGETGDDASPPPYDPGQQQNVDDTDSDAEPTGDDENLSPVEHVRCESGQWPQQQQEARRVEEGEVAVRQAAFGQETCCSEVDTLVVRGGVLGSVG